MDECFAELFRCLVPRFSTPSTSQFLPLWRLASHMILTSYFVDLAHQPMADLHGFSVFRLAILLLYKLDLKLTACFGIQRSLLYAIIVFSYG